MSLVGRLKMLISYINPMWLQSGVAVAPSCSIPPLAGPGCRCRPAGRTCRAYKGLDNLLVAVLQLWHCTTPSLRIYRDELGVELARLRVQGLPERLLNGLRQLLDLPLSTFWVSLAALTWRARHKLRRKRRRGWGCYLTC